MVNANLIQSPMGDSYEYDVVRSDGTIETLSTKKKVNVGDITSFSAPVSVPTSYNDYHIDDPIPFDMPRDECVAKMQRALVCGFEFEATILVSRLATIGSIEKGMHALTMRIAKTVRQILDKQGRNIQ